MKIFSILLALFFTFGCTTYKNSSYREFTYETPQIVENVDNAPSLNVTRFEVIHTTQSNFIDYSFDPYRLWYFQQGIHFPRNVYYNNWWYVHPYSIQYNHFGWYNWSPYWSYPTWYWNRPYHYNFYGWNRPYQYNYRRNLNNRGSIYSPIGINTPRNFNRSTPTVRSTSTPRSTPIVRPTPTPRSTPNVRPTPTPRSTPNVRSTSTPRSTPTPRTNYNRR